MAFEDYLNSYDRAAGKLQEMTRESEADASHEYNQAQVRRAIVHTREDVVMLVSHLSSINGQLATIRLLLGLLIAAVIVVGVWG